MADTSLCGSSSMRHTVVLRWWDGVSMEAAKDAPASPGRSPRRWLAIGSIAVAVAMLVGLWFLTAPDDVTTPGGLLGMQIEPGESVYVGYYYLSDRDLVIESIEPVTINGLDTALFLCDPIPHMDVLGAGSRDDVDEHCRGVEPFEPGMVIAGRNPDAAPSEAYLLVEVTPTRDQPQGLCALDITYRAVDGWRTGRQQAGGLYRVAVNEPEDLDGSVGPDEELLSACEA